MNQTISSVCFFLSILEARCATVFHRNHPKHAQEYWRLAESAVTLNLITQARMELAASTETQRSQAEGGAASLTRASLGQAAAAGGRSLHTPSIHSHIATFGLNARHPSRRGVMEVCVCVRERGQIWVGVLEPAWQPAD